MSAKHSAQVVAFEDMLLRKVEDFIVASAEVGGPLPELAVYVRDAIVSCRDFISYGLCSTAPPDAIKFYNEHSLARVIRDIQEFRDMNRQDADFFNHLSTISESICALSWVAIKPAPVKFIQEMTQAGQYYGNRVLSKHKGDAKHTNWINTWNTTLNNLEKYVKEFFLTGFTWGTIQVSGGVPPPPPPPVPAAVPLTSVAYEGGVGGGDACRQALLNDLNQGTAITNILRPARRNQPSNQSAAAPSTGHAPAVAKPKKPAPAPKFYLEGRKWTLENQVNNSGLTLKNDDMSQSLVMYNCQQSCLQVENKINNVVIDNCKKTSILLHDVISSVEVIRCERLKIQCDGNVPLINVSNSDSTEIYVNEKSRNVEIITSKSTALNVCLMRPDGDFVEFPVPEQIRVVLDGDKVKSTVVENI